MPALMVDTRDAYLGSTIKSVHFVGVGGAGMSALARVLLCRGATVTGSDLKDSRIARNLREEGATVYIGHDAAHVGTPDVVVVSTAVPESNPEVMEARERNIQVWPRAQMLAFLADNHKTIAVAGTHGKTSTSSMMATMFSAMGGDPSFCIGGVVTGSNTNAASGKGEFYIVEADESDGSFVFLKPHIALITNLEPDHLDHYDSFESLKNVFVDFMTRTNEDGILLISGDDSGLVELAKTVDRRIVTYGKSEDCDFSYRIIGRTGIGTEFEFIHKGEALCTSSIIIPGEHMVANATSVLATAVLTGFDIQQAGEALRTYKGVRRRFDMLGEVGGITIVDDYGHHPTEVAATLKAASGLGFERVVVAFQPHRYSRTQLFSKEFGEAFSQADRVVLLDVYSAGETPIPGVSGRTVLESVLERYPRAQTAFMPHFTEVIEYMCRIVRKGDIVLTMGAGDVTALGPQLIAALRARSE